jgi:hypothetical protein
VLLRQCEEWPHQTPHREEDEDPAKWTAKSPSRSSGETRKIKRKFFLWAVYFLFLFGLNSLYLRSHHVVGALPNALLTKNGGGRGTDQVRSQMGGTA